MTLDEACKILNVKPPQGTPADLEDVMGRFKRLFDANDPQKGGSFYLQSKILRARERLESEIRPKMEKAAEEAEVKEGWNPKVYKDR
jgi:mitochondrial import inner membrane translocase subunit TIM16